MAEKEPNEALSSLKRKLREILKCPVCLGIPRGGVVQCAEGHATCEGCARRAERGINSTCPVCRGRVDRGKRIRNRLVEQAIDAIEFDLSCRYA